MTKITITQDVHGFQHIPWQEAEVGKAYISYTQNIYVKVNNHLFIKTVPGKKEGAAIYIYDQTLWPAVAKRPFKGTVTIDFRD